MTQQEGVLKYQSGTWTAAQYNDFAANYASNPNYNPVSTPYVAPPASPTYNASSLSTGANPQLPALQQQLAAAQAKLTQAQGMGYTNQQFQYGSNGNLIAPSATSNIPAGWDATTYANFKAANPTLEPNAQDTAMMGRPQTQAESTISTGQAETKSLLDRIKALFTQQEGKSTYQATQEVNAGINQQQTDVQTLTNQLNSIQAESAAQQMTAEGQPIPMGFITGQQAQIQRTNAIKTLTTTALLSAKQGNLTLAQSQVDRAVALKYDPIEAELKNKMSQLELLNTYILTPAETQRKDELDREYKQQQEDLTTQKEQDTLFEKNLITGMQGGMSLDEVNQARTLYTAGNIDEANSMVAQYSATNTDQYGTGIVGEYNFYAAQETANGNSPMSFNDYQTADANRKAVIAKAGTSGNGTTVIGGGTGTNIIDTYQQQLTSVALDTAYSLLDKVTNQTVGALGVAGRLIPGSAAANFAAELTTLKANVAFSALTQMRAASKTGGALGQVSNDEEKLLSSSLGALGLLQSPDAFKAQLNKIIQSLNRWNTAVTNNSGTNATSPNGGSTYVSTSGNNYNLPY